MVTPRWQGLVESRLRKLTDVPYLGTLPLATIRLMPKKQPLLATLSEVAPLAAPGFGSCASSGRAWRPWAAQHSQGQRPGHLATWHPATAVDACVFRLQSRRFHGLPLAI